MISRPFYKVHKQHVKPVYYSKYQRDFAAWFHEYCLLTAISSDMPKYGRNTLLDRLLNHD